ncbi:DUF2798 domain-containing protein [Alisedimentitalea sp. MJ-SS2]|nr:DUF2798 domain-containing protein [Alisedimentitalea sp. MJ-SS2]
MNLNETAAPGSKQLSSVRRVNFLTGVLVGTLMAVVMSGFITAVSTGIDAALFTRWLSAFGPALLAAVPLALFVSPRARRLAERLVR